MLKGWVSKYHDRHHGYLQAFPLIVVRSIVPQEFTKIQTLFSTLQEPVNNAYICTVAATRMQINLKHLLIKGCGSRLHCESSSLTVRDKDSQLK